MTDHNSGSPEGADQIGTIRRHVDALAAALDAWAERDLTQAQPEVRRAGNQALAALDATTGELRRLRYRLTAEIRASDNASVEQLHAYLATLPARLPGGVR